MDEIQGPSEELAPVSEPESICQPPDPLPVNSCGKSALSASPTTSCQYTHHQVSSRPGHNETANPQQLLLTSPSVIHAVM